MTVAGSNPGDKTKQKYKKKYSEACIYNMIQISLALII